jgi:hypothetical protein
MKNTFSTSLFELGLRAFPPEIREMIFSFSNALIWTGKTPALLIALRQDPELYAEALDYFYKRNVFRLHSGNDWKTGDMALPALQSIRALTITFWYVFSPPQFPPHHVSLPTNQLPATIGPRKTGTGKKTAPRHRPCSPARTTSAATPSCTPTRCTTCCSTSPPCRSTP